jgi:hypothetical protein
LASDVAFPSGASDATLEAMQFYQLFMFLHIACVIVWLGCGVALFVLGSAAILRKDRTAIVSVAHRDVATFGRVFGPAALGALLCGLAMTWIAWDFHELWILIGLAGFAVSAVYSATALRQSGDRLSSAVRKYGAESTLAFAEAQRLLILGRFDAILLTVIVADMVFKPSPQSVLTLFLMAAALVAAGFFTWRRLRAITSSLPHS